VLGRGRTSLEISVRYVLFDLFNVVITHIEFAHGYEHATYLWSVGLFAIYVAIKDYETQCLAPVSLSVLNVIRVARIYA
jgi:hypothetical protein